MLTGYKTRQSNMIQINRCYTNFSKHLPLYSMPKLWNIWSKEIKQNVTHTCLTLKTKYPLVTRTQFRAKTHGALSVLKANRVILHRFDATSSDNTYKFPLLSVVFHTFI